jgi:cell division protein FtsZ
MINEDFDVKEQSFNEGESKNTSNSDFVTEGKIDNNFATKIKVIGVGGGGGNAVNHILRKFSGIHDVDFYIANTDKQALNRYSHIKHIILGENITKGLGAGSVPEIGRKAAEESKEELKKLLAGTDLVFLSAGMGGGTGTGATPVIAKLAKELGCLTLAIVTSPFAYEGDIRRQNASEGINELRKHVDSLIVVSNETLLQMAGKVSILQSFTTSNDVLAQSVYAVTSLLTDNALINVDFADLRHILKDRGNALIGYGTGRGANKVQEAITNCISSPLIGANIKGAKNAIVNVAVRGSVSLNDISIIVDQIREASGEKINIIWGMSYLDESTSDTDADLLLTVIATDFSNSTDDSKYFGKFVQTQEEIIKEQVNSTKEDSFISPMVEDDDEIPDFLKRK